MNQDIACILQSVNSKNGSIFISNLKTAQNQQLLLRLKIKSIVTCLRGKKVSHPQTLIENHLHIDAVDFKEYNISVHFEQTYEFIDRCRRNGNVLVHCHAGISRSATIIGAYLLKKYGETLDNILLMMKRKRTKINPNEGFLKQLKEYEAKIKNEKGEKEKSNNLVHKTSLKQERQGEAKNLAESNIVDSKKFKSTRHLRSHSLFPNFAIQKIPQKSSIVQKYIKIEPFSVTLKKIKQNKLNLTKNYKPQDDKLALQCNKARQMNIPDDSKKTISNQGQIEITPSLTQPTYLKSTHSSCLPEKSSIIDQSKRQSLNLTLKIQKLKQRIIQNESKKQFKRATLQLASYNSNIIDNNTAKVTQMNRKFNNFISYTSTQLTSTNPYQIKT